MFTVLTITKLHKLVLKYYSIISFAILVTGLLITIYILSLNNKINSSPNTTKIIAKVNTKFYTKKKYGSMFLTNLSCNFFNCFDIYKCGNKGNNLLVYVYPLNSDINKGNEKKEKNTLTKEFQIILQSIIESKYYTSNPNEACLFVPTAELFKSNTRDTHIFQNLSTLQFWEKGRNHLLFDVLFDNNENYKNMDSHVNEAMMAKIGFTKVHFRKRFDISLPVLNSRWERFQVPVTNTRERFLSLTQVQINPTVEKKLINMRDVFLRELEIFYLCSEINSTDHLLRCKKGSRYKYQEILQTSIFCLVLQGEKLGLSVIIEAIASGCIPVIIYDSIVMPFDEVIDWSRAAIFIQEIDISRTEIILKNCTLQRIYELQNHGMWLFKRYFKSIKTIVQTALDIIANRIFPHSANNYYFWNEPNYSDIPSPVSVPLISPKIDGFTAVILSYDRIDFLYILISKLSRVPSLNGILIVWNNQYKRPPRLSRLPKIHKVIKIIRTGRNLLSNRFYPFDEIQSEGILSLDDDIIMLTEDEIEFAFEVWREFPDRLVGFPSRTHNWDNKSACWKYESEWTNRISMVLTGAAFYHKYWNYVYTTKLSKNIKQWVDNHTNCEDIAMNFLISNITKKAPIKVTAKKKFRCPECVNTEMLSADVTHMVERTQCINHFTKIFGYMPLTSVEFRADPVLFKDKIPDKLKRFNNVGSL